MVPGGRRRCPPPAIPPPPPPPFSPLHVPFSRSPCLTSRLSLSLLTHAPCSEPTKRHRHSALQLVSRPLPIPLSSPPSPFASFSFPLIRQVLIRTLQLSARAIVMFFIFICMLCSLFASLVSAFESAGPFISDALFNQRGAPGDPNGAFDYGVRCAQLRLTLQGQLQSPLTHSLHPEPDAFTSRPPTHSSYNDDCSLSALPPASCRTLIPPSPLSPPAGTTSTPHQLLLSPT